MARKTGVPLPNNDGTLKLEDQHLQQTVAQHYLKLRARTQKFSADELNLHASRTRDFEISGEKTASTFVVLPRSAGNSYHWLIELLFLDPEVPPFGLELAGDIVMGVIRYGTDRPDLDLRAYGAEEHGVSRRHALLHPGHKALILMDLGSVNGTWIRGERLDPNVPVSIIKSTIISLGTLTFAVRIISTPSDLGNT